MDATHRVIFQPSGRNVEVASGATLLDAARAADIALHAPCGGKGTCGGCRVQITRGTPPASDRCLLQLTAEELGRNMRLACQVRVRADMTVVIPREAVADDQQILETGVETQVELRPALQRVHVVLPEPEVADQRSDADRLLDGLAERGVEAGVALATARELPGRLRRWNFKGTAVVLDDCVVHFERGDTSAAHYGVSVDLGTTTVVASLVDLAAGRVVALASAANPQATRGDDVVSRIEYCQDTPARAREMQGLVVDCINTLIERLCAEADIKRTCIYEVTLVGNTTMTHLLLRLDTTNIGRSPFVAVVRHGVVADPRDVGLAINRRGRLYVGPNIAGFLGADTVGVILATGMHRSETLQLAIDIGTNGEIVLGNRDRLLACSTAAGPAFEGARIRYGMRAAAGAIDRVDLVDGDLRLHTIGDEPALGLCGTGLLEAVSTAIASGMADVTGRIRSGEELGDLPPGLASRVIANGGEPAIVLSRDHDSGSGHPVMLTQKDIREVQLAKGAIFAGAQVLMAEMGVTPQDLDAVLLAGAFGNFIRPDRARCVGLLPDVPIDRVRFVGNAAGTGARMMLMDRRLRPEAEEISLGVEHVELSNRPDFQMHFADAMLFPC